MKKLITSILAILLCFALVFSFGCTPEQPQDKKVYLHYYNEASDIIPLILAGQETVGLIPEPAVTNLEKKAAQSGKTVYKLSLQELYDSTAKSYPQAVIMARESLLATCPDIVTALSNGIDSGVEWLKVQENVATAVNAIKAIYETSTLAENMPVSAIAGCNIYWQGAAQAKQAVNKYVQEIRGLDQTSANVVGDEFYYEGQASGEFTLDRITVAMPDGAPALGLAKLIYENSDLGTGKTVNYKVVAASNIATEMAMGTSDIVVIPVNAATKMYQKSTGYKLVSVLTHGNFYIVSTEQISVEGLNEKRIAVPQRGKVPDWTIQLALKNNGFTTEEI